MGKGSTRRPDSVNAETFGSNWDRAFKTEAPKPNSEADASKAFRIVGAIPTGAATHEEMIEQVRHGPFN